MERPRGSPKSYCREVQVQWEKKKQKEVGKIFNYRLSHRYYSASYNVSALFAPLSAVVILFEQMHPGARYESITPRTAKRNAFVLCVATRFINSGLRRYKSKVCSESHAASFQTIVRIS